MKQMIDDVMATVTDEQYFRELYAIEKAKPVDVKQQYINWLYENYAIGNGHALTRFQEDTTKQLAFIEEFGLPDDVELI